jgi:hypothetical protein
VSLSENNNFNYCTCKKCIWLFLFSIQNRSTVPLQSDCLRPVAMGDEIKVGAKFSTMRDRDVS